MAMTNLPEDSRVQESPAVGDRVVADTVTASLGDSSVPDLAYFKSSTASVFSDFHKDRLHGAELPFQAMKSDFSGPTHRFWPHWFGLGPGTVPFSALPSAMEQDTTPRPVRNTEF